MKKLRLVLGSTLTLTLLLTLSSVALAGNGIYPSKSGVPTNKNQTPGLASTTLFGNVSNGAQVYTTSCVACHGVAGAANGTYPGIGAVNSPVANTALDPGLYDINPAIFSRDLDSMLQHGSQPGAPLADMPAWGDKALLTQAQIADVEAYVMSLSGVKWPTLALNGTTLSGSSFVPSSTVQLYQNNTALSSTVTPDTNGNFSLQVNIPTGQTGTVAANYAVLNVSGIYPGGDKTQGDLGLDGNKGATYKVASVNYAPAIATTNMPKTGSNALILALIGAFIMVVGIATFWRKPSLKK